MTALGYIAAGAGAWIVLAALGTAGFSTVAARLKRDRTRRIVDRDYPPPPPPPPSNWSSVWPQDEPANWDDLDEVMFRWFAEGRSAR